MGAAITRPPGARPLDPAGADGHPLLPGTGAHGGGGALQLRLPRRRAGDRGEVSHAAKGGLEPITTLAALATVTEPIGLIATASTTYTEPFNLARQFASLDHISGGRVGWNIVTSWAPGPAPNFGHDEQIEHAERYERAPTSWRSSPSCGTAGRTTRSLDDQAPAAMPIPTGSADRPRREIPQGARPAQLPARRRAGRCFVQAGSSTTGRRFAAQYAEAVFTAHLETVRRRSTSTRI